MPQGADTNNIKSRQYLEELEYEQIVKAYEDKKGIYGDVNT
jgi:hypothetical protein